MKTLATICLVIFCQLAQAVDICCYQFDADGFTAYSCQLTAGHAYTWIYQPTIPSGSGVFMGGIIARRVDGPPPWPHTDIGFSGTQPSRFITLRDDGPAGTSPVTKSAKPYESSFVFTGQDVHIRPDATNTVKTTKSVAVAPLAASPLMPPPLPKVRPRPIPKGATVLMHHRKPQKARTWNKFPN